MHRFVVASALLSLLSLPAAADPLQVTAVRWVPSNGAIPHDAVNGRPFTFKAIVEGGECDGSYLYHWDVNGDGDFDDEGEGEQNVSSSGYAGFFAPLSTRVAYPDAANDRIYFARVEVMCGEETGVAELPVEVRVDGVCPRYLSGGIDNWCDPGDNLDLTRRIYSNVAISDALWWGFKQFSHRATDAEGREVHLCWVPAGYPAVATAALYLAATRRSHRLGPGSEQDPYFRHLSECALHAVVDHLSTANLEGATSLGQPVDTNENGLGLHCTRNAVYDSCRSYESSYIGGPVLEVLANFGDPAYEVPTGIAPGVFGRPLSELSQDYADYLAYCMADAGAPAGSWGYGCHSGGTDTSTTGWPGEALRIVEDKNGNTVPQFVKDANEAYARANCGTHGCTYGEQWTLAGNGLTIWGMARNQVFDPDDSAMWNNLVGVQNALDRSFGHFYAMYATTKGMRAFVPELRLLPDGRDWNALYSDYLVGNQAADGSWSADSSSIRSTGGEQLQVGLGIQVLESWLNAQPRARAFPTLVSPGDVVVFDHAWSYVLDPDNRIVSYRWNVVDDLEDDLDGDGQVSVDEMVFEFQSDNPGETFEYIYRDDLTWGDVATHTVTLEVVDNLRRRYWDSDSVRVEVSLINHAPAAVVHPDGPGGVYVTHAGFPITLDASASFDPDRDNEVFPGDLALDPECDPCRPPGVADRVTAIGWDLDQDGVFEVESARTEYTPPEGILEGNRVAVPVIVCDDGQWNGECYDDPERAIDCSTCTTGVATVHVIPNTDPVIDIGGPYRGVEGQTLVLDGSGSVDPELLALRYYWDLDDDGGFDDGDTAQVDYVLGAGPAEYPVALRIIDHGNRVVEARTTITVDNAPPPDPRVVVGAGDDGARRDPADPDDPNADAPNAQEGEPYPIDIDSEDPGGDDVVHHVDCDGDGTPDWSGSEGTAWCTFPDDGAYEIVVWTEDADGEESGRTRVTVTVDNVDPKPTVGTAVIADEGEVVVLYASVYDPGQLPTETDRFTWDWGDGSTSEGDVGTHAYIDDGRYTITLTAHDKDGGTGSVSFQAIVANVAPWFEGTVRTDAVVGQEYLYEPRVADPGKSDTHEIELTTGPSGLEVDAAGGAVTWTPGPEDRGYHEVVLVVTDNAGARGRLLWTLTVLGPRGEVPGTPLERDDDGPTVLPSTGCATAAGGAGQGPGAASKLVLLLSVLLLGRVRD